MHPAFYKKGAEWVSPTYKMTPFIIRLIDLRRDTMDPVNRREFVKEIAVGATSLAASNSLDAIAASNSAQTEERNEPGKWAEAIDSFKDSLARAVKPGNIVSDPGALEGYSKDCSFVAPGRALLLVFPENQEEVRGIVRLARESKMPLIPVSSRPPRFHGDTVPSQGGVVVDFSKMNHIVKIDPINRCAIIEPGVSYGQLIPELRKLGLRLDIPLLPRAAKSVVASHLEREPTLIPKYQFDYMDPLLSLEVVYGTGDVFRTGSAFGPATLDRVYPWGPGAIDYVKFLSGAQGTMGLVTWAATKTEVLPSLRNIYFISINDVHKLLDPMIGLLRRRVVDECLALNRWSLATILAENWPEDFQKLSARLPPWMVIVCISGYQRRPQERIDIQERYLKDICEKLGLRAQSTLPGAEDRGGVLLELLSGPWNKEPYWKLRHKGSCREIFFLTTLSKVAKFIELMMEVAARHHYPVENMGCYVQPMVQGRGCHCEFNLPCNESDPAEMAKIKDLFIDASETLFENGAFFNRPYGPWSDMVYGQFAEGVTALRKLKGIFDPDNILNPGKLCF
jgi:FAD/FMN-containing dehydrogenase